MTPFPRIKLAAALALLLLYLGLGAFAMLRDSSVADEHPHVLSGWLYCKSGSFSGGLDNPPLGQLLVALPLHVLQRPYRFPADDDLWLARLPVLLLSVGLAGIVGLWARRMWGAGAGLAVLLGFCLEPNLLAHGHLATLDLPLTALWWIALWSWRRYLRREIAGDTWGVRLRAATLFALAFTAATLTKFSGLLLAPMCALVAAVVLTQHRQRLHALVCVGFALVVCGALSHLVYGFEPLRAGLPVHLVDALEGKWAHRGEGHFAYLAGRRSNDGFPEYYIATLLLKTPLPLLLLALVGCVLGWRRLSRVDRALLLLPPMALLALFSWAGVNIGVRHILPVYPALLLLAALGMRQLASRAVPGRVLLLTLVLAWGVGVARIAPQYIPYFNVLAGGPTGGHTWLLDSNLDWGQDDARLDAFLGAARARGERWQVNPPGDTPRLGRFAVNANVLHNLLRRNNTPYAWLRPLAPIGFAGYSWRLYDLSLAEYEARAVAAPGDAEAQVAWARVLIESGDDTRAGRVLVGAAQRLQDAPRITLAAAQEALDRGDLDAAGRWVARGLARNPDDVPLQLLRARVRLERDSHAASAPDARAQAALALGLFWAEQREIERAVPHLEAAARVLVRDVEAQRALGIARARLGQFDAALAVLDGDAVAGALAAEADACRQLAGTERDLARAARGGPPVEADRLRELARVHFGDERFDRAAAALVQLLRQQPDDAAALALVSEAQVRCKLRVVEARLTPRSVTPEVGG